MAYDQIYAADSESKLIEVMVRDSTTGAGKTGLAYGSVAFAYVREGAAAAGNVTATCVNMTQGTWTTKGWIEVDATNQKGVYQFGVPNAALAVGAKAVTINFQASGMIDKSVRILLDPPVDAVKIGGTAQSAGRDLGTVLPAVSPTVAGGLAISQEVNGGVWIQVSLLGINGTEIDTDAAGLMAAAFSKLFNVAAPVLTAASVNQSGDAYAVVNHATYGNSALHTDVADVHTDVGTALTNIADLHTDVGTAIANIADLHTDVADVHTDVGTALTNIADLHTDVGTAISQTTAATLVTALWDLADGIEIDLTPRQAARAVVARAGFGLISGAGTGVETVKGAGVTTTRLVLTDDSSGNITAAAATLT